MTHVRQMQPEDASAVARLHALSITEGFLARLGHRFLRQLYLGVNTAGGSVVFVAGEEDRVLGFCAYAQNVGTMYRRVLRARFFRLGFASLPYSLKPSVLKEVFETLRYPAKQSTQELPAAEILSIATDAAARGMGVGRALLDSVYQRARADGESQIKVLAGARLDAANRFYRACGFERISELMQHGETLNVYARSVTSTE